jgi:spermidine synthase
MSERTLTIPLRGERIAYSMAPVEHFFTRQSRFQTIDIYETEVFGKVLTLDGHVQLTQFDEHAYHESLVHLPGLSLEEPRRALVVGGGDGGVLRELCRYRSLEVVEMVEIDEEVVKVCREHLPEVSGGAFEDPRVRLHIGDAFPFVKEVAEPYDLIVVDSTDVYEAETGLLSERLFTEEFYRDCHRALTEGGIVVTQADNPVYCPYSTRGALETFGSVFARTGAYLALVPSFGGYSACGWASKGRELAREFPEGKAAGMGLRYLNRQTWAIAFTELSFCPVRLGQ